jgi:hypothetical protein
MMEKWLAVDNKIYDPSDARKEFGLGRKPDGFIFSEIRESGRNPVVYTFAEGSTGRSDITDLQKVGLITAIDVAYVPTSQDSTIQKLATVLSTNQDNQELPVIFGGGEDFREWLGDRVSNRFVTKTQIVKTKTWELTYDIARSALEDDKTGLLERRARAIADAVSSARLRQVVRMYINAPTTIHWLDGQYVIDIDHDFSAVGGVSVVQSNKDTNAPLPANILAGIEAMIAFQDWNGNGFADNYPDAVLFGPKYWAELTEAFNSQFFHAGATSAFSTATGFNPLYQRIPTVVISSQLVGNYDDYAFLIRTSPVAPVIILQRSDVADEFVFKFDPQTSDRVAHQDVVEVLFRGRWNLLYGPWHHVYGFIS